jgi:hypothetical protein
VFEREPKTKSGRRTIALGDKAVDVSERLGHATIGITLDSYPHVLPTSSTRRRRRWTTTSSQTAPTKRTQTQGLLPFWAAKWQQLLRALGRNRLAEEPV